MCRLAALALALLGCTCASADVDLELELSVNALRFTDVRADNQFFAAVVQPKLAWADDDQSNQFIIQLFYLHDTKDQHRTHLDAREFYWLHQAETWELQLGITRIFWGVAESRNIVNVINQQDAAYGFDKSYRLGQPLVSLTFDREESGLFSFFVLPYFREQTMAGRQNPNSVSTAAARYQDSAKERHVDFAARYSNYVDEHEFALSWFRGTDRIPFYVFTDHALRPFYRQIAQFGVEYQLSYEGWLWKFEGIHKSIRDNEDFFASVAGVEYTLVGVYEEMDLGLLAEWNWDERGARSFELLQNDTFLATRLVTNDVDGTELLVGISVDNDVPGQSWTISGSKRFGDNWKGTLSGFLFDLNEKDPLAQRLNDNDYLELQVSYYL